MNKHVRRKGARPNIMLFDSRNPGAAKLQLTERQAEILRAVELYGTHTEAARRLGISRQSVSRVVARCRTKGYPL